MPRRLPPAYVCNPPIPAIRSRVSAFDPFSMQGAAQRGTAPSCRLVRHHQLLQQHIAGDVPIGRSLAATCQLLAIVAL